MEKQNDMAQLRYLEEVAISLKRAGFDTGRIEDHHLPVSWNGSYLCRISGKGSVLYRQQNVDANGAQAELQNVIDIAKTTSEYMEMMERAPQLKARDLEGDYRVLADFNGIVLAGHPTSYGVRFITWEWDWNREGVHTGNYFYEHYEEAKRDFATRSGLVPKDALFAPEQLIEIYHALRFTREQDESLSIGQDRELKNIMTQVEQLVPENDQHRRESPEQSGNNPPRGSEEWKLEYNARTSAERCNKREKLDYKLEDGRYRSSMMWYCRLFAIMMCQHLDAWTCSKTTPPRVLFEQVA